MNWLDRIRVGWKKAVNERLYRRIPTNLPVKIHPTSGPTLQEVIGNWSPGGIFVSTEQLLPIGSMVSLEFSLGEKESSVLKLQAQVVRHQKHSTTGNTEGYGVMFTDFTQSGLQILRNLLTQSYPELRT